MKPPEHTVFLYLRYHCLCIETFYTLCKPSRSRSKDRWQPALAFARCPKDSRFQNHVTVASKSFFNLSCGIIMFYASAVWPIEYLWCYLVAIVAFLFASARTKELKNGDK